MLELLSNIAGTVLGGGATGLLGAGISKWMELRKLKEQNRHDEEQRRLDLQIAQAEVAGKIEVAKTEADAAVAVANATADAKRAEAAAATMRASYEHDKATYSTEAAAGLRGRWAQVGRFFLVLVDVMRGVTRPLETWYFTGLATYLTIVAVGLLDKVSEAALIEGLLADLVKQVFMTVLYITVTCILWWFGTRPEDNGRRV